MLTKRSPLIFGEVLFDKFNDKNKVLGGAPFNVAWHFHGFGFNPFLISRIGNDENGKNIIQRMKNWGMYLQNVQIDETHPTGIVSVTIKNNEPHFKILEQQAYDYIEYKSVETLILIKPIPIIYHGTLALRNEKSRSTLAKIKNQSSSKIFLDVNLREPWWTEEIVLTNLKEADWLKCNEDELQTIIKLARIQGENTEDQLNQLCQQFALEFIIVTQGAKGAMLVDKNNQTFSVSPKPLRQIKDTVGAGDGFSAVSIIGILNNWDSQLLLERATEFASRICQNQGATLEDEKYYKKMISKWEQSNEN